MSKAHDPHWRYVAFRADGATGVSRRAMQNAILGRFRSLGWSDGDVPKLTRYEWPHGIVRVDHRRLADCRAALPRMDWAVEGRDKLVFRVTTLSSSGTLKALTDRIGLLRQRAAGPTQRPGPGRATPGAPARPGRPPRRDGQR